MIMKTCTIPDLKIRQVKYEIDTWKRLLDFMNEENIRSKDRLSEILQDKFDKNLLEEVECFHGSFLKADGLIVLLRNDVTEVDDLLTKGMLDNEKHSHQTEKLLKRLRNNMVAVENQFSHTRSAFNSFLLQNIL